MSRSKRNLFAAGAGIVAVYSVMKAIAKRKTEDKNIDDDNPYNKSLAEYRESRKTSVYEGKVKPFLDQAFSFGGLVFLSPLFALISLAVYIDDPGPVFFTQKRVGKNKTYFMCHKFRSMKMIAPPNVPTHQLNDPDRYITRVGKVLRKTSMDELPQIWDIFRGRMSVIGPRPALWNQKDLVAERDKYGANDVMPGLTGLAQIRGRDELQISDKAKLDGEYVDKQSFLMDVRCFFKTIVSVLKHDGVVEGGTGSIFSDEKGKDVYVSTSPTSQKNILILGAGSYIGENIKDYLQSCDSSGSYIVDVIETKGLNPVPDIFKGYDVVINTAGVAHRKETNENRSLYYEVNRDLSVNIAKAAKEAEVKQLILLSSMSVYGMTIGHITKGTVPYPSTAYGESKLSADEAIEEMADEKFKVVILRPPMVYGKGCKGNYQILRSFALKSPIFPAYKNERSMIFIGNLCEYIKRILDIEEAGLFFPQNDEYVQTLEMVNEIVKNNGKKMHKACIFNPIIKIFPLDVFKRVFGTLTYEKSDLINKYSFEDSMQLTEHM